jgi:predicted HicB family RNase H-like nuclease
MKETDSAKDTPISKAKTLDEVADYWDEHSLADHWDETREAQFEVRAKRRRRITVDPEVYAQIEAQARKRGISPETLINLWLAEHIKKDQAA